jgi:hypothetical protein
MYMDYKPVSEIASKLGIPRTTIQYHVSTKWKSERVLRSTELASEFSEAKTSMMNSTFSTSFKVLAEWVRLKASNVQGMKAHEAKTMMDIISNMDKIMRLDVGSPTDIITDTVPVDVIEVRKKILKHDPFLVDADFREIKDGNSEKDSNSN